jgi:hypothetical protein
LEKGAKKYPIFGGIKIGPCDYFHAVVKIRNRGPSLQVFPFLKGFHLKPKMAQNGIPENTYFQDHAR